MESTFLLVLLRSSRINQSFVSWLVAVQLQIGVISYVEVKANASGSFTTGTRADIKRHDDASVVENNLYLCREDTLREDTLVQ